MNRNSFGMSKSEIIVQMNNLVNENDNDDKDPFGSPDTDPFTTGEKVNEEDFFEQKDKDELEEQRGE